MLLTSFGGPNFLVNSKTSLKQYESATASSANGSSVAVWTDQYSTSDTDIKAQLFDPSGNKVGGEIWVAYTSNNEHSPTVGMDSNGNFVVAWVEDVSGTNKDIYAARFTASGAYAGCTTVAASGLNEYDPSLAVAANGTFVVSYTQDTSATNQDVRAHLYTAYGAIICDLGVSTYSWLKESHSSAARAADGRFAIAYQADYGGGDIDVHLARYDAGGNLLSNQAMDYSTRTDQNPKVSMDDYGNSVVVYEVVVGGNSDIKYRRVNSSGAMGTELTLAAGTGQDWAPSVALDRTNGKFVVAYNMSPSLTDISFTSIIVREVSASDAVGAAINLGSSATPGIGPAVSVAGGIGAPSHRYMVTFTLYGSSYDYDVFSRAGSLA
jgi:hypothetical protein